MESVMSQRSSTTRSIASYNSGSFISGSYVSGSIAVTAAPVQDYLSIGLRNLFYNGSRISSTSINSPTPTTPDGKAVVEVFIVNANTLTVKNSSGGKLSSN
jgi:hypothetical protein